MSALVDFLTSQEFQKRPHLYSGASQFAELAHWLRGLEFGFRLARPGQPDELDGFREWLHVRLDAPGNFDWQGMIAWKFGAGKEATDQMFDLLGLFRADVASRGLPAILEEHRAYETRRYGSPVTSQWAEWRRRTRQLDWSKPSAASPGEATPAPRDPGT